MLIRTEFDIQFKLPVPTHMVALLHLHPSLESRVRSGNELHIEHTDQQVASTIAPQEYRDVFENRCSRLTLPAGDVRVAGTTVVEIDPVPDEIALFATQALVQDLPPEVLQFLLPSRYCEVDRFVPIAQDLFGSIPPGWQKASAIRDWVHQKVAFDYTSARPTKTATDVFSERVGVCRDYQHLAVTLSRCQNIPARYATGYLGDIRWPFSGPGDFSAWYEVYLDGRWITMDARHNEPRIGRVLMATGRDAADVAITTSFGNAILTHFYVDSFEVLADGTRVAPLPGTTVEAESAARLNASPTPACSLEISRAAEPLVS